METALTGRPDGKRALVFGAGSSGPGFGNGKAAALQFAREGASVACVDLSADSAQETAEIIRGEGLRPLPLPPMLLNYNPSRPPLPAPARPLVASIFCTIMSA